MRYFYQIMQRLSASLEPYAIMISECLVLWPKATIFDLEATCYNMTWVEQMWKSLNERLEEKRQRVCIFGEPTRTG